MKFVPAVISKEIARNALHLQKASPEVLMGVGILGMVGSTVLACRATLKMTEVLEEAEVKREMATNLQHPNYSQKDRDRDLSLIRFQSGVKIVRLYMPAIVVGAASIYCLRTSHGILNRRNAALTAAYAALEKGFNDYRARVVEKYGEDEDRDFRYGTEQVEIIGEDGKKKMVTRVAPGVPSIYARFFDPTSASWEKNPEYNLSFLNCQQNWANDQLRARGHVFLNEVYDMLGIPRSKAGSVVGWVLSDDNSTDNFINFGVFDGTEQVARDFVNGREGSILLDFNVDGVIYDKLEG
jgi:Family of unknown function (DUF6353)